MTYKEIQNEVINKYSVIIVSDSKCWSRMHAHVKERIICKWIQKNSAPCTFDLFHEIGHIETYKSGMRRCESEFSATQWAIEKCHEYGIIIPDNTKRLYQEYIGEELLRGVRRGGKNYPKTLNLKW